MFLRLTQIYEFVKEDLHCRNMNEGEEVLKSGQVITVGCSNSTKITPGSSIQKITGLVLQTSALSTFPHTIEGIIKIENEGITIQQMKCSCKAGMSGVCKHVVAVLLFLERNDIASLEDLSCTDLKRVWSSRKKNVHEEFAPAPVNTFFCAKRGKADIEKDEVVPDLFYRLCALNPNAAIALHQIGRGTAERCSSDKVFNINRKAEIIHHSLQSTFFIDICNLPPLVTNQCCNLLLNSLSVSNPVQLCYDRAVSRALWRKERKLRVSGSRIYSLFTYDKNAKPNWEKKARTFFWPKEFTNKYVKHGIIHEQFARQQYETITGRKVEQCGSVVNPDCSRVGYSPDGVVFGENGPELLLELKCSYLGKTKAITECLDFCPFLDENRRLKIRHPYYGQVQLGQLILNVKNCGFGIYSSFDQSMYIVQVPFDKDFAHEMLLSVRNNYLSKMLHCVCKERENNNTGE